MPGVPTSAASFTGHTQFNVTGQPISVDAVYDGQSIVHVLINVVSPDLSNGTLSDYPFDLTTNSFKPAFTIDGNVPFRTTLPIGTAGVSGMVGRDGTLNVAYWSNLPGANHITYKAYAYNPVTNGFVLKEGPTQIDTNRTDGMANHPALVVSPLNGDITLSWLWQSLPFPPPQAAVYARTKTASGWGSINQVNSAAYKPWVDANPSLGLNVDQGPSMVITADGTIHLTYNEDAYTSGGSNYDYGRVHYVTSTSGASWVDTLLIDGLGQYYYTHDPSLTTDSSNRIYLFGHSDWRNSAPCTASYPAVINCYVKKNPNGPWTAPQQVKDKNGNAVPPSNPQENFDDSVSMKWGVVGWNRPELVEFAFFSGKAQNYWDMSLYYGTLGD
jgi:hypothetical protein